MGTPLANARRFLKQKLRETIAECGVPALAAVLVRKTPSVIVSAQLGIRMAGASGAKNNIRAHDRFNLGSISKVFTGHLIGRLIQDARVRLNWTTSIADVYPRIWDDPEARDGYKDVTVEHLLVHTSGMPYEPAGDEGYDWLTYTARDMTKPKLMQRRRSYIKAAVLDPPKFWPPGVWVEYGGGAIIAASMAEGLTQQTYEDLMQTYIYGPLGMTNSGFGRLWPHALDGPWQHLWNEVTRTIEPDMMTQKEGLDWNPRNPVGGACCSAADLGKFLREQVRNDPQLFSVPTRKMMQTGVVTTASSFSRGGWSSTMPGSNQADIGHNGSNGVSYANMIVSLSQRAGFGAMSNVNSKFGAPAVNEMIEVLRMMDKHWHQLFDFDVEFVECAHPMPAVVRAGQKMFFFARRHNGKVYRYRSIDGGASWLFAASFAFTDSIFTSGLAADISSDSQLVYFLGRGKDNRIWFTSLKERGANRPVWKKIPGGTFLSGPAVTASGDVINVFALGMDNRMYQSRSDNGGEDWSEWKAIFTGTFTSAPAVTASSEGVFIQVFARGMDRRIWRNFSGQGGLSWEPHWKPIGEDVFTSGPGATASSNGSTIHLVARGTDRQMWRNMSVNSGADWSERWELIPSPGTLTSAPALATTRDGSLLQIFAFGGDFMVYKNESVNGGDWTNWQQISLQWFL